MHKDEAKGAAQRGDEKEKIGKAGDENMDDKNMKAGGTAGTLDEDTKHGLGKSEDKIRDRLKD